MNKIVSVNLLFILFFPATRLLTVDHAEQTSQVAGIFDIVVTLSCRMGNYIFLTARNAFAHSPVYT